MFHAKQAFDDAKITPEDIPAVVYRELSKPGIGETIKPGMSIAVTAGSRGVANVNVITRAIVDFCKEKELIPSLYRPWEVMEEPWQRDRRSFWQGMI